MIKVKIDGLAALERKIDQAKRELGLTAGEHADKSAQVLRDTVVRNAQPFGLGKTAREKGEKAILGDLHKCFRILPNNARGRRVIRNASAAANFHQSRRNGRGRVSTGERRQITAAAFGALYARLKERVGMAKGSVMGGGKLKSSSQKWIKRHDGVGDAKRRKMFTGAEWTFTADPAYVASSRVLGMAGVRRAMSKHRANLNRALNRDIRREMTRVEKRANR